jgi:uncharacterized protein
MHVFAHLWLRRFTRGPVEWLWNSSYQALAKWAHAKLGNAKTPKTPGVF